MRNTCFGSAMATLAAGVLWLTLPAAAAGQAPAAASQPAPIVRGADGHPDIQGWWETSAYAADMETGLPDEETATIQGAERPDQAKAVSNVIDPPDGRMPYQAWAAARRVSIPTFRRGETSRGVPKTLRDIRPRTFCLHGTPRNMVSDFQVVQTGGLVVLAWEFNHAYRLIPLDGRPPLPGRIKLVQGHSVGRWEGDTLVVQTTNVKDWDWFDYTGTFHTDAMTLVERFTVVDANTIDYRATVTDPNVFTRPWTFRLPLSKRRVEPGYEMLEHACVEGERGVEYLLKQSASAAQGR
jgi:hypothetical protein